MQKNHKNDSLLGITAFIGILFLIVFHLLAIFFYLYWFYWWLDTLVHFLGGFSLGLLAMWVDRKLTPYREIYFEEHFFRVFLAVFIISVFWEVFEVIVGYTDPSLGSLFWAGTLADITAGLLGGSLSIIILFYVGDLLKRDR
ncbi:MAG: hypothetical protein ACQEP6_00415 [Patescibacteria group bacterium]